MVVRRVGDIGEVDKVVGVGGKLFLGEDVVR